MDKMIIRVFKRVKSASGRMPHMVLTGRWCGIATMNAHARSENYNDHSKDKFYEDLEEVSFHLLKYRMKFCY